MDFSYKEGKRNTLCSGIYQIKNLANSKVYVGSSKNIYFRIAKHKHLLVHCKHDNPHLQNAVNHYGLDSFEISVLEICTEGELAVREQYWMSRLCARDRSTGYNKCDVNDLRKNVVSDETKRRISQTLMHSDAVKMIDCQTGTIIEQFASLYDAAVYINENQLSDGKLRNIRMKISEAIRHKSVSTGRGRMGKRVTAYGYKWEV